MSVTLTAVVFACDQGDSHAPLSVRRRGSRFKAPTTLLTYYADGGWTNPGAVLTLDEARVDRALLWVGYRRAASSRWTPLAVEGGTEWHATVEREPAPV